jgi:hypothetical protein
MTEERHAGKTEYTEVTLVVPRAPISGPSQPTEADVSTPSIYYLAESSTSLGLLATQAPTFGSLAVPDPIQRPEPTPVSFSMPAFALSNNNLTSRLQSPGSTTSAPSLVSRTASSIGRNRLPRPDPPEIKAKKEELAGADTELQETRAQAVAMSEEIQRRREELASRRVQLQERTKSFQPFLDENRAKLERSSFKCEREQKIRKEKEEEIREMELKLDVLKAKVFALKRLEHSSKAAYRRPLTASIAALFQTRDEKVADMTDGATDQGIASSSTFTLRAVSGDDPDIDDVVIAYRTLERRADELRKKHSKQLAATKDLAEQIAAIGEVYRSDCQNLTKLSSDALSIYELGTSGKPRESQPPDDSPWLPKGRSGLASSRIPQSA